MEYVVHWFRRDLRLKDNAALHFAQQSGLPVKCLFIFDDNILNQLPEKTDTRVSFIFQRLQYLKQELRQIGSDLLILKGKPKEVWAALAKDKDLKAVFTNRDYEPYAKNRDLSVKAILNQHKIPFYTFKDQVIFEAGEVLSQKQEPYKVYTPYKNRWRSLLNAEDLKPLPVEIKQKSFLRFKDDGFSSINSIEFNEVDFPNLPTDLTEININNYEKVRDFPCIENGTSHLGAALRFGTVSIREVVAFALKHNEIFLSELIWREFFSQILWYYPSVEKSAFKKKYDNIQWRNNEAEFKLWCLGQTGYPLVDAGMRELNATGFMHNRVRMITASFLVKHLLIDWRWGEAYFAQKLMDFDLAANNGNWQWVAGCGTDAAPYFRIFNPEAQAKKFDAEYKYIKKWIPEWGTKDYPSPIVEHKFARERCLKVFKEALKD